MKKKQSLLVLILTITLFSLSSLPVNAVQRGSYNNLFFGHLGAAINTVLNLLNYPITIQGYSVGSVRFAALQNIPLWIILAVFFILYSTIFFALKHVKIFQGESARGGRIATALALAVISEFGTTLIPNLWRTLYLVSQLSYALFVFVALTAIYIAVRTYWEKRVRAIHVDLNKFHRKVSQDEILSREEHANFMKARTEIRKGENITKVEGRVLRRTDEHVKKTEKKEENIITELKNVKKLFGEYVTYSHNSEQGKVTEIEGKIAKKFEKIIEDLKSIQKELPDPSLKDQEASYHKVTNLLTNLKNTIEEMKKEATTNEKKEELNKDLEIISKIEGQITQLFNTKGVEITKFVGECAQKLNYMFSLISAFVDSFKSGEYTSVQKKIDDLIITAEELEEGLKEVDINLKELRRGFFNSERELEAFNKYLRKDSK